MTKKLTKQWHNADLENGWYYVKPDDSGYIDLYKCDDGWLYCGNVPIDFDECKEVLAPVPSYDKLQTKDMLLDSYKKENKRLKAVAEYCENVAGKWADKFFDTEKKMECVEKQLEIATKALKEYERCENGSYASKALALIKEVK